MQAKYIIPFLDATALTLRKQAGIELLKDRIDFDNSRQTSQELNVIINFLGKLNGSVTFGMSQNTAKRIASALLKAHLTEKMLVCNTIVALSQAITVSAQSRLLDEGFDFFSMAPMLITGKGINVTTPIKERLSIYMNSSYGQIELKAAFYEQEPPRPAPAVSVQDHVLLSTLSKVVNSGAGIVIGR